ncbi:MAG: multicopper oxidase domain-containing protein [Acidobacteriota bacterium]
MTTTSDASDARGADPRTFVSVGPNVASLGVVMNQNTQMADGASIRTWYFPDTAGSNQGFNADRILPSPLIECVQGQTVQVTLASPMPHTIHFHGLDVDQANDGVGNTSGFVAPADWNGSFGRVDGYTNLGSPFTYTFVAPHAGTYMYHCHVDTVIHLERGMFGTVIVRPSNGQQGLAWDGGPTFDREFVWQLSTFDSSWPQGGGSTISGPSTVRYRPDYFLINGVDGANAQTDSTVAITAAPGETVLLRLVQFSYVPAIVDLGGLTFDVIASDGRPLAGPMTNRTEVAIAAGERYDLLFTMPTGWSSTATVTTRDIRDRVDLGSVQTPIMAT